MADQKITQLTAYTTPLLTDIIPIVKDPAGTPATDKITLANLLSGAILNLSSGKTNTTSSPTTASTTYVDLTSASVTVTTTGGAILLNFRGNVRNNTLAANISLGYVLDSNAVVEVMSIDAAVANDRFNCSWSTLITGLAAGSHTFKIQWKVDSGTGTMGGTTFGYEINVIEV